jgi:hypothetical protein
MPLRAVGLKNDIAVSPHIPADICAGVSACPLLYSPTDLRPAKHTVSRHINRKRTAGKQIPYTANLPSDFIEFLRFKNSDCKVNTSDSRFQIF